MLQKDSSHLHPGYYSSNPMTVITITITFTTAPADVLVILGHLHTCSEFIYSWHHQMKTFSVLLTLCSRNPLVTGEFPSQRPVMQSFDVFFVYLNKRLSKQSKRWWFDMPLPSLWCHCNVFVTVSFSIIITNTFSNIAQHCWKWISWIWDPASLSSSIIIHKKCPWT